MFGLADYLLAALRDDRKRLKLLTAAVAGGFLLRLAFVLWLGNGLYQPDERGIVQMAQFICENGFLKGLFLVPSDRPVGASLPVALAFSLSGNSILSARLLNVLISTASIAVLYAYTSSLFGGGPALLAALAASLYPFFIYWSGMLMTETPTVFLVLCAFWFTHRLLEKEGSPEGQSLPAGRGNSWLNACAGGFSWSLLIFTRAQNLYFLPVIAGWIAWKKLHRGLAGPLAAFFAMALLLPALWTVRNRTVYEKTAFDIHGGITLLMNTVFYEQSRKDWGIALESFEKTPLYSQSAGLSEPEKDAFYRKKAGEYVRQHPWLFLRQRLNSLLQFWRFYPRTDKSMVPGSPFIGAKRTLFTAVSLVTEPFLLTAGLCGLFIAFRKKKKIHLPFLFILMTTAVHALVAAQMRYRLPVMPIVIMFACYALWSALQPDTAEKNI
ncbi:MAG: glycosyltransferase family 39 protein [bacterium]